MSDLVEQIDALLALNAKGAVSHPVPGLAVELLTKAAEALRHPLQQGEGRMSKRDDFTCGMAAAAGIIMQGHGDDVLAGEILGAAGLMTVSDMRKAGVDPYDIRLCVPVLRHFRDQERAKAYRRQALSGGKE